MVWYDMTWHDTTWHYMSQHVKEAAHNACGSIELIFTRSECRDSRVTVSEVGLSKQFLIACCVQVRQPEITVTTVEGRRWKRFSNSKLNWSVRYCVRTWDGRHRSQLANCSIDIQMSCRLYSIFMLLATSKRDKDVFLTPRYDTWYEYRDMKRTTMRF